MTTDTPITAAAYADLVRAELTDLPPDDLASMVEGLDAHLAEIAADGQADLVAALGAPAAYAAELRSAAGLPAKAGAAVAGWAPPTPQAPRRLTWSSAYTARSTVALTIYAAAVAVAVVRRPAGVAVIAAVTAGVAVAWWAVHTLLGKCELSERWVGPGRALVATAAIATATLLGAVVAHPGDRLDSAISPGWDPSGEQINTTTTIVQLQGHFTETMVQVANCSAQNGVARMMTSALGDVGFTMAAPTYCTLDPKLAASSLVFNEGTPGAADVAMTLAKILGLNAEPADLPIPVETGVWAEGSGVVLLLGDDLAGKTLDQIQGAPLGAPTSTTFPAMSTTSTVVSPTAPPAAPGTLRFTVEMPDVDGTAEVRDVAGQVCVYIHLPDGDSFGCYPLDAIESGNAWSATKASSTSSTLLVTGLAVPSIGFHLLVGDDTIMPDANGFWYVALPTGTSEFTIVTDRTVTPVNVVEYHPLVPPTTTTVYNP